MPLYVKLKSAYYLQYPPDNRHLMSVLKLACYLQYPPTTATLCQAKIGILFAIPARQPPPYVSLKIGVWQLTRPTTATLCQSIRFAPLASLWAGRTSQKSACYLQYPPDNRHLLYVSPDTTAATKGLPAKLCKVKNIYLIFSKKNNSTLGFNIFCSTSFHSFTFNSSKIL